MHIGRKLKYRITKSATVYLRHYGVKGPTCVLHMTQLPPSHKIIITIITIIISITAITVQQIFCCCKYCYLKGQKLTRVAVSLLLQFSMVSILWQLITSGVTEVKLISSTFICMIYNLAMVMLTFLFTLG